MRLKLVTCVVISALASTVLAKGHLFCYWLADFKQGDHAKDPSSIPVDKCTHVVYDFLDISETTDTIEYQLDGTQKDMIKKLIALKERKPNLKVILSIGGWTEALKHGNKFSRVASQNASSVKFAKFVNDIITEYEFDGVDVVWRNPGSSDRAQYTSLLKDVRNAIGKKKLLTVVVSGNRSVLSTDYEIPKIEELVNFFHVATFDPVKQWEHVLSHQALLRRRASDSSNPLFLNVENAMDAWQSQGVPKHKLIMGIPIYGRTFYLNPSGDAAIGAPTRGRGRDSTFFKIPGTLAYFEVCKLMESWTQEWDNDGEVPFIYNRDEWISHENKKSIILKIKLLNSLHYGGAMVWPLNGDDMDGTCESSKAIEYPLVDVIHNHLDRDEEDDHSASSVTHPVLHLLGLLSTLSLLVRTHYMH